MTQRQRITEFKRLYVVAARLQKTILDSHESAEKLMKRLSALVLEEEGVNSDED
jgi:hypothetical protein